MRSLTSRIAFLFAGFVIAVSSAYAAQNLQTISVTESNALIQQNKSNNQFSIIDVRTPKEYAQGHLANSKLINFRDNDFETKLNELDKSKTYLIYCRSGGRSGMALTAMERLGFESVYNMDGGFNEWSSAAFPFEK